MTNHQRGIYAVLAVVMLLPAGIGIDAGLWAIALPCGAIAGLLLAAAAWPAPPRSIEVVLREQERFCQTQASAFPERTPGHIEATAKIEAIRSIRSALS